MVLEVAIQHPVKPCTNHRHGFVPSLVERLPDRGQRGTHTLLGRQPDDLELTLSVRSTAMREPKEVERIRSALPVWPENSIRRIPSSTKGYISVRNFGI